MHMDLFQVPSNIYKITWHFVSFVHFFPQDLDREASLD